MFEFTVPGHPQGKARARTVRNHRTGRSISYTPPKTANYEMLIRQCFLAAPGKRYYDAGIDLSIDIVAFFQIPKKAPKYKRDQYANNDIRPTYKPDVDNIAKVVCDALNGVAYRDDAQIVDIHVSKRYTELDPRVHVSISKIRHGTAKNVIREPPFA